MSELFDKIGIIPALVCTFLAIIFWVGVKRNIKSLLLFTTFLMVAIASWIRYLVFIYPEAFAWTIFGAIPVVVLVGPTVFAYVELATVDKKPSKLFISIFMVATTSTVDIKYLPAGPTGFR